MRTSHARFRAALVTAILGLTPIVPAQAETTPPKQDGTTQGAVDPVQTLEVLLRALEQKRGQIRKVHTEMRRATEGPKLVDLREQLLELEAEEEKLQRDFESVATGIDVESFADKASGSFQLGKEVESLLQPLIQQLKEVTKEPRQIEQLRSAVETRRERASSATRAIVHVERLLRRSPPEPVARELEAVKQRWQTIRQEAESEAQVAQLQLEGKLRQRKSLVASSRELIGGFFRTRGLNLLMAFLAFLAAFFGLRFFARPVRRVAMRRMGKKGPSFYARMLNVAFLAFTLLVAIVASLMVLYAAGDWLMLGLMLLFLFGVAWAGKNALPKVLDQVRLMLNLGAVREGERVILNGVPWRVQSLNVYTRLVNPELAGGMLRLPIRHLVGLHSRPVGDREVWFPCREGDWVVLADRVRGKVVSQSPDMVQLVLLGGARVTYKTEAFLELNPTNLSANFRVSVVFGVDYQHQAIATTRIPAVMNKRLEAGLREMVGEEHVVNVQVEFREAGASSLDVEVLADFAGAVAARSEALRRAIQRILVDTCTENGWVIPFTQLTLHQAKTA